MCLAVLGCARLGLTIVYKSFFKQIKLPQPLARGAETATGKSGTSQSPGPQGGAGDQ